MLEEEQNAGHPSDKASAQSPALYKWTRVKMEGEPEARRYELRTRAFTLIIEWTDSGWAYSCPRVFKTFVTELPLRKKDVKKAKRDAFSRLTQAAEHLRRRGLQ